MDESHVSGLYLTGCYAAVCMRMSVILSVALCVWQWSHIIHGDDDVLMLSDGTCIYFLLFIGYHVHMIGCQWIRMGMMVSVVVSYIYFI